MKDKKISLIIIIANIIFIVFAINYFSWFNSDSADVILNRYLEAIKTGEGQLAVRLIDKFDWLDFKDRNLDEKTDYTVVLRNIDRIRSSLRAGELKVISKRVQNRQVSYTLKVMIGAKIKTGAIVLIKRADGWRILHDSLFNNI